MTLATLAIVLAAAFIHALWNLIVVAARDRVATTTIVILFGAAVFVPIAVARWNVQAEAWPYIALSSVLELVYFVLLVSAYERAELSLVYPIARGSAPVLVLALAVAFTGAATSVAQVAGVALVAAGVFIVRLFHGQRSSGLLHDQPFQRLAQRQHECHWQDRRRPGIRRFEQPQHLPLV